MGRRKLSMLFRWLVSHGALVYMGGVFALSSGVLQAQEVPKTCPAEPTDMAIGYGDSVACEIQVIGDVDLFRFSGASGEIISVQMTMQSVNDDSCIELFKPDGELFKTACTSGNTQRIDTQLDSSGNHTLRLSDSGNDDVGPYLLTLFRIFPLFGDTPPAGYGDMIAGSVGAEGDVDLYYFPGSSGDTVSIQMTMPGVNDDSCIELFMPDGTLFKTACSSGNTQRIDTRLDSSGNHTLRLSDYGNNDTGEYQLTNNCISGPCNTFPDVLFPSRLANMSTRGYAGIGDQVMIAGFIIGGDTNVTVLIRGRGPSVNLPANAVKLSNPHLRLVSGQTTVAENDNWQSAPNADSISATGKAPPNVLESAILETLAPGAYTAILSGADGNAGVGIVEVIVIND